MFNKLFTFITILAATVSIVSAGGDLKLCTAKDLGGHCETISYLNNDCINLDSDLEDQVRSVDPLGDSHKCYLYEDQNCEGDHFDFTKHHNNLEDFNDLASSFYCNNA